MRYILAGLFMIITFASYCGERPIYIGDIIKIAVSGDVTEDDIKKAFEKFEIKSITKTEKGEYNVEVFSMEPCEEEVVIGGANIKIKVSSLLGDDSKDILDITTEKGIDGKKIVKYLEPKFEFPVTMVSIIAIIFIIIGLFWAVKRFRKEKEKKYTPLEIFDKTIKDKKGDFEYLFSVYTIAFKEYIDAKYGKKISGKTSGEISVEISELDINKEQLNQWLVYADMVKFAGKSVSQEEGWEKLRELRTILLEGEREKNV